MLFFTGFILFFHTMFSELPILPEDPIFSLNDLFKRDSRANKINLGIGIYQTEEGSPHRFCSVDRVEREFDSAAHTYLPIGGDAAFLKLIQREILGEQLYEEKKNEIVAVQTVGGTGALSLFASLEQRRSSSSSIYLPKCSWSNHFSIFSALHSAQNLYPYNRDYYPHRACCQVLSSKATERALFLFQACCHNPSGIDPSPEEWEEIASIVQKKSHFVLFDCAYQGWGREWKEDVQAIGHFVKCGIPCAVAYSCSKNFALYGQRLGALLFFNQNKEARASLHSNLENLIRSSYSNPPLHGAKIVKAILSSKEKKDHWQSELKSMRERIDSVRNTIASSLSHYQEYDFSRILRGKGMFSLFPLSKKQVHLLREHFAIYILANGRVNLAALSERNLPYFLSSLQAVFASC